MNAHDGGILTEWRTLAHICAQAAWTATQVVLVLGALVALVSVVLAVLLVLALSVYVMTGMAPGWVAAITLIVLFWLATFGICASVNWSERPR